MPVLILNLIFSVLIWYRHAAQHPHLALWWIVLSFIFFLLAIKGRTNALRAQDRLIRLEERLRLTALLPAADHPHIHSLTPHQLIALRFASDAELSDLARRAWTENLTSKQIKQAITNWRPDDLRI